MNTVPLGLVDTPSGPKPIYPMNDVFINYTFDDPEHWEALRSIANTFIAAYAATYPTTTQGQIAGTIQVETQLKHFKNATETPASQDLRIEEVPSYGESYIELQNKPSPKALIPDRSINYFGMGISKAKGDYANQIWLIAGDVPAIFNGQIFARYTLQDEKSHSPHPHHSGILYVNLKKLSQEPTDAGKLATWLLGNHVTDPSQTLEKIMTQFSKSFNKFKEEKEILGMISLQQRWIEEGEAKGEAKGKAELIAQLKALVSEGLDPAKIVAVLESV